MRSETADRTSAPLHGRWRVVRAAALGGASMLLASGAHLLGGGRLPSAGLLLVCTFLVGLTAVTVTARRLRFGLLLAVLSAEQFLLHEVFDAAAMASAGCTPALGDHATAMAGCLTLHATASAGPGSGMVLAHAAATVATALLLARGERGAWTLCERAIRAATLAPTSRVRRPRPPQPPDRPGLASARRVTHTGPRAPPAAAWSV